MDGFPREGMPEDEGNPFPLTQVSQPRPRAHTFDRDDHILPIGGNNLEEGLGVGVGVVVDQNFPVMGDDTDVHRPGMHIDATGKWMLLGVESHEVSSSPS
jgi:hypothetical protein